MEEEKGAQTIATILYVLRGRDSLMCLSFLDG